jgi:hypothetical protein
MLSFGIWDSMACEMDVSVERETKRERERERTQEYEVTYTGGKKRK